MKSFPSAVFIRPLRQITKDLSHVPSHYRKERIQWQVSSFVYFAWKNREDEQKPIPENEKAKTLKSLSSSDFLPINAPEYNLADWSPQNRSRKRGRGLRRKCCIRSRFSKPSYFGRTLFSELYSPIQCPRVFPREREKGKTEEIPTIRKKRKDLLKGRVPVFLW